MLWQWPELLTAHLVAKLGGEGSGGGFGWSAAFFFYFFKKKFFHKFSHLFGASHGPRPSTALHTFLSCSGIQRAVVAVVVVMVAMAAMVVVAMVVMQLLHDEGLKTMIGVGIY